MASGSQNGKSNNPKGKPAGVKAKKTKEWEVLAESIITIHAKSFNSIMVRLSIDNPELFVKIYKDILNYFKPKISHNLNEEIVAKEIKGITFDEE